MNGISRLTLLALVSASLTGCMVVPVQERDPYYEEYAQPVILPPPPPRYEYPGYAPVVGSVWIAGNWNWVDSRYIWVSGRWETPRSGYYWIPHRWERDGDHWRQHGGRWERDTRERHDRRPEPRMEQYDSHRPAPAPLARPESDRHPGPEIGIPGRPHSDPNPIIRPERDRSPGQGFNGNDRHNLNSQPPSIEGRGSRMERSPGNKPAPQLQPERDRSAGPNRNASQRYEHMDRQQASGSAGVRVERNVPPPALIRESSPPRDQRSAQRPDSETKADQKLKGRHTPHRGDKDSE